MKQIISFNAFSRTSRSISVLTIVLCMVLNRLFHTGAVYPVWYKSLPGLEWINWNRFLTKGIDVYTYGWWYLSLAWAPLYNILARKV